MHGTGPTGSEHRFDVAAALNALETSAAKKKQIGHWLDADRLVAREFWHHVERCGGLKIGDWNFVADPNDVESVLQNAENRFSVREYNRRMRATSGRFFLGMDGTEHDRDAELGRIIPSWNVPHGGSRRDLEALATVRAEADRVSRAVLVGLAKRTRLARRMNPETPCAITVAELIGTVLDACATRFFGVPGPSSLSLITWAKEITSYHFRVHASEDVDRSRALQASATFRAHVLSLIATSRDSQADETQSDAETSPAAERYKREALRLVADQREVLRRNVDAIRSQLQRCSTVAVSDDDVARNLIGIMIGSLTATAKGFGEALKAQDLAADGRHIRWADVGRVAPTFAAAPASYPANQQCPCHPAASASSQTEHVTHAESGFALYEAIVAGRLSEVQRGSLDAIYRTYESDRNCQLHSITIEKGDTVIVWLGGTLSQQRDNLFGIGVHKCPGMDMAKAIMQGILQVLTVLEGADGPVRAVVDGELYLAFDRVEALEQLDSESHVTSSAA
jgi:cytochrome P450